MGSAQPKTPAVDKEALKQDPKFSKYFKMLSVGVPAPSVYGKMANDGMGEADVNLFKIANGDAPAQEKPKSTGLVVDKEALKQDPKFTKYFKMLSVGVPAGNVYSKMANDGIAEADINMFKAANGELVDGGAKGPMSPGGGAKPAVPLLKLHWDAIKADSISENSVWASPRTEQHMLGAEDMKELETLFSVTPTKCLTPVGGSKRGQALRTATNRFSYYDGL